MSVSLRLKIIFIMQKEKSKKEKHYHKIPNAGDIVSIITSETEKKRGVTY